MEYRYKPTTHGRSVMAACMALERPFHITRVAFGSGKIGGGETNLADVHELLEYVSDGAVAERRHEDDRLYLTIQFSNQQHPAVKTFLLSEFIVYVEDPVTGEDTDLIYGTLGDYRQPVPAYNPAFPPSEFNFPLTLILSDEINVAVSAPSGLVTHAELLKLLDGIGTDRLDVVVPASGWAKGTGPYPFYVDIAIAKVTEKMIPKLDAPPEYQPAAAACGLCPTAQTLDGMLRVYSRSVPAAPIRASLTLLDTAYQTSGRISGSAAQRRDDILIPATGWTADSGGVFAMHRDIPVENVTSKLIPSLFILPESLPAAFACGMSSGADTMNGLLRVYAMTAPKATIKASLALMGLSPYAGGGGTSLADGPLPVATEKSAGVVKPGAGLAVSDDGTLSVDTATVEEVTEMLSEEFSG